MQLQNKRIILAIFGAYLLVVWGLCLGFLSGTPLFAIGVTLTAFGGMLVAAYYLMNRAKQETAPAKSDPGGEPRAEAPPAASDDIIEAIHRADSALASSPALVREDRGRRLADLPLLLLVGAAGAGKTTLVTQSGIEPQLLAGQVQGEGGIASTRVCNIWYGSRCTIAEAGGRLFLRENARWVSFLEKLKGSGWRTSNLRGVILCVDAGQFASAGEQSISVNNSDQIRRQLRAIADVYHRDFPVYVVFTRSDSLSYFQDAFRNLNVEEESMVFGCDIEPLTTAQRPPSLAYQEHERQRLSERFEHLYYNLTEWRIEMLAREGDAKIKAGAYEFAREFRKLEERFSQFLVDTFAPNPLQPGPLLRGFYFTGMRQVSTSMDDQKAARPRANPLLKGGDATVLFTDEDAADVGGRSSLDVKKPARTIKRLAFVRRLFTQVFPSDPVAYEEPIEEPAAPGGLAPWKRIACIAAMGLAVFCSGLFAWSWWNNSDYLSSVKRAVDVPAPSRSDMTLDDLNRLDALRIKLAEAEQYENSVPWRMGFLLYAGHPLPPKLRELYFTRFRQWMLDPTVRSVADRLRGLPPVISEHDPYQDTYDRLRALVTVTAPACPPERPFLPNSMTANWSTGRDVTTEITGKARLQFEYFSQALIAGTYPFQLDPQPSEPVNRARDYLRGSREGTMLQAIISQVNRSGRAVKLEQYTTVPQKHSGVMTGITEVEYAFSYRGAQDVVRRIRQMTNLPKPDPCVLGTQTAAESYTFSAADVPVVIDLYVKQYIQRWLAVLTSSHVLDYPSYRVAADRLGVFKEADNPLLGVLRMVRANTDFTSVEPSPATPLDSSVGGLGGSVNPTSSGAPATLGSISNVFKSLRTVFPGQEAPDWGGPVPADYTISISELQRPFAQFADSPASQTDQSLHQQARGAYDKAVGVVDHIKFDGMAGGEAKRLMMEPLAKVERGKFIRNAIDITKSEEARQRREHEKAQGDQVKSLCGKLNPLLGRNGKYPFNPDSMQDAAIEEVNAVFAPDGGELWNLYNDQVRKLVMDGRQPGRYWESRPEAQFAPGFREAFSRLTIISDVLYAQRRDRPKFAFRVAIPDQDPGVTGVTLQVGSQQVSMHSSQRFEWTGDEGDTTLTVQRGAAGDSFTYRGVWGIFALLSQAEERTQGRTMFGFKYLRRDKRSEPSILTVDGHPVTIRIQVLEFPNGVESAFDKGFFSGLACPGQITR